MKFTVQGKELLNQLNASAKVLNSKNAIAILDNLLIRLEGDTLFITASDSENVMTSSLEVFDAEGEGKFAVPAKRLMEMIKEIANQPIKFEVTENNLINVEYQNGKFSLMGVDPAAFPLPSGLDEQNTRRIEIPAEVIKAGLGATMFAVSTDNVRPIMTGIFWDFFEDKIIFVSSDTHKLVRYENTTFHPNEELSFVLHSKTAGVVNSLLDNEGMVEIRLDQKSAVFKFGNYELNCRFLKGKYPQYDRVIPNDNPYEIVVDRQTLISAVRRVGIFASKASLLVKFGIDETGIKLSTQDLDYSLQASEHILCDYNGIPLSIGFRTDYTNEVLSNLNDDTVIIKVSDSARPALFLPQKDKEGEKVIMLQMPVQVLD